MRIELPISKSIANRLLILQAIHGDGLVTVSCDMPDDVQILHRALTTLKNGYRVTGNGYRESTNSEASYSPSGHPIAAQAASCSSIELGNCGTAMRFLTAYCAQLAGQTTILDGVERMHHRPIGQLVDALREIGAQIDYVGEEGFPPLRITGKALDKSKPITLNHPQSTQFVSALLLIGANVQTDSTSPYITLTREMIKNKEQGTKNKDKLLRTDQTQVTNLGSLLLAPYLEIERDWSSAAFWYEHVALHGGEITLPGLSRDSLQGDKVVADIFAHLGVHTEYTEEGITITKNENDEFLIQQYEQQKPTTQTTKSNNSSAGEQHTPAARKNASLSARCVVARAMLLTKNVVNVVDNNTLIIDFSACPDLYPAVALTCERLGIALHATGVESLPLKESDRLRAVAEHRTDADHRMAMALLIAGYEVDDTACISKSYPQFLQQWQTILNS